MRTGATAGAECRGNKVGARFGTRGSVGSGTGEELLLGPGAKVEGSPRVGDGAGRCLLWGKAPCSAVVQAMEEAADLVL